MRLLAQAALCALSIFSTVTSAQRPNNQQQPPPPGDRACNNSPSLCDKSYGEITHLGAHNSAFVRDESTSFSTSGNHYYNTTVQLQNGVRLLTAQLHNEDGMLKLCHSQCFLLDAGQLRVWLTEVRTWMDRNPSDVVTILLVNADNASGEDLAAEFEASGISRYGWSPQTPGTRPRVWPTLGDMISANKRLVTFIASLDRPSPRAPYLLDEFTYVTENKFENTAADQFNCLLDRPSDLARRTPAEAFDAGYLYMMNHFLYKSFALDIDIPDDGRVNVTNSNSADPSSLASRIRACTGSGAGRAPTFVMVDFFNVGPAVASVDAVNGVRAPVGRKVVGTEQLDANSQFNGAPGAARSGWAAVAAMAMAVLAVW